MVRNGQLQRQPYQTFIYKPRLRQIIEEMAIFIDTATKYRILRLAIF